MLQLKEQILNGFKQLKVPTNSRFLLAISGGVDSVVLGHILAESTSTFDLIHCNFNLRGIDSLKDAEFIKDLAEELNVKAYIRSFDTISVAESKGLSIQVCARELRYNFFEEVRSKHQYDFIITAHHANDQVETMLFHLAKGTGLRGLEGIPPRNGRIIRPMLGIFKKDILEYAKDRNIIYREDATNSKNDYSRNLIRNKILPLYEEIDPAFQKNLIRNIARVKETNIHYFQYVEWLRKKLIEKRNNEHYLHLLLFKKMNGNESLLYELLKPFGISGSQAHFIYNSIDGQSGKRFFSEEYELIKDRRFLIITKKDPAKATRILIDENVSSLNVNDGKLQFQVLETKPKDFKTPENEILVDASLLDFPLVLRKWKKGDYFYPFGMQKKKKKVSDLFIDKKLDLNRKKETWILESANRIVWVVGIRSDQRFAIGENTSTILKISFRAT